MSRQHAVFAPRAPNGYVWTKALQLPAYLVTTARLGHASEESRGWEVCLGSQEKMLGGQSHHACLSTNFCRNVMQEVQVTAELWPRQPHRLLSEALHVDAGAQVLAQLQARAVGR